MSRNNNRRTALFFIALIVVIGLVILAFIKIQERQKGTELSLRNIESRIAEVRTQTPLYTLRGEITEIQDNQLVIRADDAILVAGETTTRINILFNEITQFVSVDAKGAQNTNQHIYRYTTGIKKADLKQGDKVVIQSEASQPSRDGIKAFLIYRIEI